MSITSSASLSDADRFKAEGNTLYRQEKFIAAINAYSKASEAQPTEPVSTFETIVMLSHILSFRFIYPTYPPLKSGFSLWNLRLFDQWRLFV
jgi:hypothetical protein